MMYGKVLNNPEYDLQSAIQCLDLAPLNEEQMDKAIVCLKKCTEEWLGVKKTVEKCDEKAEKLGFFLRKRMYQNIKFQPSQLILGLVDYDIIKKIKLNNNVI